MASCEICGKRIFFWDVHAKICMDCLKKKMKGKKVKWMIGLKK